MLTVVEQHSKVTYSMSGTNQLCPKDHNINSENECKQAATFLRKTFKDSRRRSFFPKGCYFHHSSGYIFFNTDSAGYENSQAEQICKVEQTIGI